MKKYLKVFNKGKYLNAVFTIDKIKPSIFKHSENIRYFNIRYKLKNGIECTLAITYPINHKYPLFIKNKNFKINVDADYLKNIYVKAKARTLTHRDILNLQGPNYELYYNDNITEFTIKYSCTIPKNLLYKLCNISVKDRHVKKIKQYICYNSKPYYGGNFSPK